MFYCICKLLIFYHFCFNILTIQAVTEDDKQWNFLTDPAKIMMLNKLTKAGFCGEKSDKSFDYRGSDETAIEYQNFLKKTNFRSSNYMKMYAIQKIDFPTINWNS
ncbi:uncharacterized protein LOC112591747 isoform X2 [Melanaphis sacchari]|uniref:uncharacterized protein LOC112591747 isoform X2 n=1 Tax=Melanaphis sacchari TaxID=742174 RepID=UPI000DC13DA3|nr:uncharacterized protein LOC112591747 isoform X2 [Melanaphis sacchari]